jgi:hypothetical protein
MLRWLPRCIKVGRLNKRREFRIRKVDLACSNLLLMLASADVFLTRHIGESLTSQSTHDHLPDESVRILHGPKLAKTL